VRYNTGSRQLRPIQGRHRHVGCFRLEKLETGGWKL